MRIDKVNKCFRGTENALNAGKIIRNPRVLFTVFRNGEMYPERYADFDSPKQDTFHYLVHKSYGVPISYQQGFLIDNKVVIKCDYIDNYSELRTISFSYNPITEHWEPDEVFDQKR